MLGFPDFPAFAPVVRVSQLQEQWSCLTGGNPGNLRFLTIFGVSLGKIAWLALKKSSLRMAKTEILARPCGFGDFVLRWATQNLALPRGALRSGFTIACH